ncbi:hypothetical protein [Candidatus Palauibacter sp.]|uniref:hypothetical protein n=1 Tax=Candidatus Palauibacter sp. TaxID=3101350 RepID=UPI003B026A21
MEHLTTDEIQRHAEARDVSAPSGGATPHLASCARCRGEVGALRAVLARLDGLGRHEPAGGFADGVARRIDLAGAALEHELGQLRGWSPTPAFATAVLARVRLPVPWPERLLRFVRRRKAALASAGAATLAVSGGGAVWLFGVQGFGPGQLVALATAGGRAMLVDAAVAAGRLGYRLGLVDAGGSILDRVSPAMALASLALSSIVGMASLWVMASLFRRPAHQPIRLRKTASAALIAPLLACVPATLPASAQEAGIADATITLSAGGRAELWFELEDGTSHRLRFEGETIELDGEAIGAFAESGVLASGWRDFLREHAGEDAVGVRDGLLGFRELLGGWETTGGTIDGGTARALGLHLDEILELAPEAPAASVAAEIEAREETRLRPGAIQIVPGGLGFDVAGRLERLREALRRLGAAGESIDDRLAMIVHDDFGVSADRTIAGDVAILDGTLSLEGAVAGDVLLLDGALVLADGAHVEGDVLRVGGDLDVRGESATVAGEILSDIALAPAEPSGPTPAAAPPAPAADLRLLQASQRPRRDGAWSRFTRNLGNAAEGLIDVVSSFLILAVFGLGFVAFARQRLETVADTVRREFARSFAMGIAGQVLFFPALLVLIVLFITWPIVPFFLLTVGLAGLAGYMAVAHGAGEMFARRRFRYRWLEGLRRSNSYYYVTSGLALLLLPFAAGAVLWVLGGAADLVRGLLMFVASLGTWVLITAGFGGVLLTRGGGRSVVVAWPADVESARGAGEAPGSDGDDATERPPDPASGG